ncbi:MAG: glycosyltransferase [Thermosphaera sp.]
MPDIHVVLTQDLNSPSGQGRYLPFAKELSKLGYELVICTTHSDYKTIQDKIQKFDSIVVRYVHQSHVRKRGDKKYYFSTPKLIAIALISTIKLILMVLRFRSKVIIVGKPHPMNSIAGIIGRMIHHSILIVDIDDDEENSGNFRGYWQKQVIRVFQRNVPRFADIVTTNTQYMKEKLIRSGIDPHKIFYLPNGIDICRLVTYKNNDLESSELKARLGINGKIVITYIGSISFISHPIPLLLQAFKVVSKLIPNSVLLIIGGGEDIHKLMWEVRNLSLEQKVLYIGKVAYDEIVNYYSISDVAVDPVYDNDAARGRCPLKLFEAWFFEVPFVTGDVGDRRMLSGEPPSALLCKPGDPAALAQAIIEVVNNPKLANALKLRGKERVKNYYWNELVSNFVSFLNSLDIF